MLVAVGQAFAIPPLGQRVDAAAIRGEAFGRQPGELELAVGAQADVAAVVERDDAVRVIGGELAVDIDRFVPIVVGGQGPGLLQSRCGRARNRIDLRRGQLGLRRGAAENQADLLLSVSSSDSGHQACECHAEFATSVVVGWRVAVRIGVQNFQNRPKQSQASAMIQRIVAG